MKLKKRKSKQMKKVCDPFEKCDVGLDRPISMVELYITNRELFNLVASGEVANLKLNNRVWEFFTKSKVFGKSYYQNMEILRKTWEVYNNKKRRSNIRATTNKYEKENIAKDILTKTIEDKIKWEVILDSRKPKDISNKYKCNFDHKQWIFTAIGYTKEYDVWHFHYELQWTDENEDSGIINNAYNREIYEEIKKRVKKKIIKQPSYAVTKKMNQEKKVRKINNGDFVIRTNLFKCFHKKHIVEEIIAIVSVVTKEGKIVEKKVPGAYCPKCNCYFLLEQQYKKLKESGILLCQVVEGKIYYQDGCLKNMNMAKESLLMQNGYNVKANNGLTDVQRQIILANIIDNKILAPHTICSYLGMFISQKKNLPQYREAVLKWEKDRNFVFTYKNEIKRKVEIQSIKN